MDQKIETHPYPIFVNENTQCLIIGTFPAWEFTSGNPSDIDPKTMINFNYGRIRGKSHNALWKILSEIFQTELVDVDVIKALLVSKGIGMADVCHKVIRKKPRSSMDKDLDIQEYNLALADLLKNRKNIHTLFFTSKTAYEWYFKNIHPLVGRSDLKLVTELPPLSQGANIYIAGLAAYKEGKFKSTYEYRLSVFRKYFSEL